MHRVTSDSKRGRQLNSRQNLGEYRSKYRPHIGLKQIAKGKKLIEQKKGTAHGNVA